MNVLPILFDCSLDGDGGVVVIVVCCCVIFTTLALRPFDDGAIWAVVVVGVVAVCGDELIKAVVARDV